MRYSETIVKGTFEDRPNRFIAHVNVEGKRETVHVKNTGRCRELLVPGAAVWLALSDNPERKTKYDLVAAEKKRTDGSVLLVNIDSQLPNAVAAEWIPVSGLFSEGAVVRREVTHGDSRFDLYVEDGGRKAFIEVKGCTLEENGICRFPDAPTERGVKHVNGLMKAAEEGYEAYLLIIVPMEGMKLFRPNDDTHPQFGAALRKAAASGVRLLVCGCSVTPEEVTVSCRIPYDLAECVPT